MQIEPNTFICADSIEVLREIPDKVFDLCLTDPPYGIDYGNAGGFSAKHGWATRRGAAEWDLQRPSGIYFSEMLRVSESALIWGGNYFTDFLFPSMGWVVWDKGQRNFSLADAELAWYSKDKALRIFEFSRGACVAEGKHGHPTQKPVALFVWCLLNYSKPGDLIIDPFCGSGTTAMACHKTGRKFLCIDKDEEYIKIAQQRYADLIAQQDLFGQNEDGAQNTSEGRGTDVQHPQVEMRLQ